jgi:hypothetical protein
MIYFLKYFVKSQLNSFLFHEQPKNNLEQKLKRLWKEVLLSHYVVLSKKLLEETA